MKCLVMIRLVAALLAFVVAAPIADGAEYVNPNRFKITTPDDWVRIPPAVLTEYTSTVNKLAGQSVRFDAGFERHGAPDHFVYPYILIQYHAGRTPAYDSVLKEMTRGLPEEMDKASDKLSKIATDIQTGKPVPDPARHRVSFTMEMNVAAVGKVKGLTVMQLGRSGVAQMNFYALASEFNQWLPAFEKIADSCTFDSGHAFDPATASSGGGIFDGILGNALIGGLLGGVVGLVIGAVNYFKKKKAGKA